MESGRDNPEVELPEDSGGLLETKWLHYGFLLTNDLNTLSACAKMVQPDGNYFHFKAEKLGAQ